MDWDVQCGGCGAHFQLGLDGDVSNAACSECGGKRFFRSQPSPTQSDGTLRDMVDSESQKDQGGNPLGEGTIMGDDGEKPRGFRDNYMHSNYQQQNDELIRLRQGLPSDQQRQIDETLRHEGIGPAISELYRMTQGVPIQQSQPDSGGGYWDSLDKAHWANTLNMDPYPSLWEVTAAEEEFAQVTPDDNMAVIVPSLMKRVLGIDHQLKFADNLTPSSPYGDYPAPPGQAPPAPPGAQELHKEQQQGDPAMDAMGLAYGLPLLALPGADAGEAGALADAGTSALEGGSAAEGAGAASEAGGAAADTHTFDLPGVRPTTPETPAPPSTAPAPEATPQAPANTPHSPPAESPGESPGGAPSSKGSPWGAAGAGAGAGVAVDEAVRRLRQHLPHDGEDPQQLAPPYPMEMLGSTDIPMLLVADYDTPQSIKSVDEQHDDPEHQDQKEFNDDDNSPSNLRNPNNDDSGIDGEDGVRDATPGFGFGPHSPGLERMDMMMPLLMHYHDSDQSGADDPLVRGLHETLERESPGYLHQDSHEGDKALDRLLEQLKSLHLHGSRLSPLPPGQLPDPVTNPHGPAQRGKAVMPNVTLEELLMPDEHPEEDLRGYNSDQLRGERVGTIDPSGLADAGMGRCPSCGGVLAGDGSCPQCGAKAHPQGGAQIPALGGGDIAGASYPPNKVGNRQGPVTDEQKEAIKQLVEVRPELFGDILDKVQKEPNTPPLVDPSQMTPPAPQPGQMDPSGSMPVPGMGGAPGGQPMQPMAKQADANNNVPRCPKCGCATTSLISGIDNDPQHRQGRCHNCQNIWDLGKESRVSLTEMPNPLLQDAAEQHEQRPEQGQDSSLTWVDADGQPLVVGQIYALHAPGYDIPDEVKVVTKKPDALGLSLVGEFQNLLTQPDDPNVPDFSITPDQVRLEKYKFVPEGRAQNEEANPQPKGGMPGMEQIPQSGQTTDEATNSYPNQGTVSSILASESLEDDYEDTCHRCGGDWIDHVASSPTLTMHECARCGAVWESRNQQESHEAHANLNWVLEDSQDDDFFEGMERAQGMREHAGGSRDISSIASNDERLQAIRNTLNHNKGERQKLAGRHFTPSEQRALVNEKGKARNLDMLDIEDTHYATRYDDTGKANPYNVPDSHLLLGL